MQALGSISYPITFEDSRIPLCFAKVPAVLRAEPKAPVVVMMVNTPIYRDFLERSNCPFAHRSVCANCACVGKMHMLCTEADNKTIRQYLYAPPLKHVYPDPPM